MPPRTSRFVVLSALAITMAIGGRSLADTSPLEQTKAGVQGAINVLRDKSLPLPEKRQKLRALSQGNFDFADMARSALGYHWKELSDDQRKQFTDVFSAFIEDAYLNRIQEYAGQDVQFVDEKQEEPGRIAVESRVVGGNADHPIPLNFMLKQEGSGWKIYDVTVDSISITANYRNQFNRVINNQGFDKLMSDLREKLAALSESLGK
jgi:phospholipid transport system substrate-binding protein